MFCLNCQEKRHNGKCGVENALKNIREFSNKECPIRACPSCGFLSQKDENCEHVECFNCQIPYNFCCSSIRSPSLAHG